MDDISFKLEFLDSLLSLNNVDAVNSFVVDFLVEKWKLSNCCICCNDLKHSKVDNSSLAVVYASVEQVLNQHVSSMRSSLVSESLVNDVLFSNVKERNVIPQHVVAVPLLSKNVVIGFVVCYAQESLSARLELLSWLCERLVVVFDRIKHFSDVKHSALTDALTGVFNRVYFDAMGTKELEKLHSDEQPSSLVLFDIDDFKVFNDTHGHVAGDQLLMGLGQWLLENVDKKNIVCRFGGEEFVVFLPDAKSDVALSVAENFRTAIAEHLEITISVGIVSCLNSSVSLQKMVQEADIALYKAKSSGKNCCVQRIIVDKNLNAIDVNDANEIGKTN